MANDDKKEEPRRLIHGKDLEASREGGTTRDMDDESFRQLVNRVNASDVVRQLQRIKSRNARPQADGNPSQEADETPEKGGFSRGV